MTHYSFVEGFRSLLDRAGVGRSSYYGHSFRRRGATTAFMANIPAEYIKLQGDWSSDCYRRYIDVSSHKKLQLAYQLRDFLSS